MKIPSLVLFILAFLVSNTASSAGPPSNHYLKVKYSLTSDKRIRTGVIYNRWIDGSKSKEYINVPDKLLSYFNRIPDRKIRIYDEILLYKPPESSFDGFASFTNVRWREASLKDIKYIKVIHIYTVDYGSALHSSLTKNDIKTWAAKKNKKLIVEVESGVSMCRFSLYRHGAGKGGAKTVDKVTSLARDIDFDSKWRSDPSNSEYIRLLGELRKYKITMFDYCGC